MVRRRPAKESWDALKIPPPAPGVGDAGAARGQIARSCPEVGTRWLRRDSSPPPRARRQAPSPWWRLPPRRFSTRRQSGKPGQSPAHGQSRAESTHDNIPLQGAAIGLYVAGRSARSIYGKPIPARAVNKTACDHVTGLRQLIGGESLIPKSVQRLSGSCSSKTLKRDDDSKKS